MTDLKQIREVMDQIIEMELKLQIEKLVVVISEHYNIDKNEIYEQLKSFETQLDEKKVSNEEISIDINDEKCLGKTKYNTQCSRSRQRDCLFCGSHLNKLPYGRVDNPTIEKIVCKKRGRPRKDAIVKEQCETLVD